MEEIKLEIHDTDKPNFISKKEMGKILRFFTWHVPFTSLESSKVATSIYTMAVLSRSPGPQNHRYTATQIHINE